MENQSCHQILFPRHQHSCRRHRHCFITIKSFVTASIITVTSIKAADIFVFPHQQHNQWGCCWPQQPPPCSISASTVAISDIVWDRIKYNIINSRGAESNTQTNYFSCTYHDVDDDELSSARWSRRWWTLMVTHTNYCSCTYHYSIRIEDMFNLRGRPDEVVISRMMARVCWWWCTMVTTMIVGRMMTRRWQWWWSRRWLDDDTMMMNCRRPDDGTTMPPEFYQYMKLSSAGWWHDDAGNDEVIVARGWWHDNADDAAYAAWVLSISIKINNQ